MDKPPYVIPTMSEIAETTWNGYTAISTFSGCGGSCLGYRMAGFRVAWASEFIPAAQTVYRLNHPETILDTRDIRQVTGQEILESLGKRPGEIDLLDGSPPCASFSTVGIQETGWGKVKEYSDTQQRVDDLFFEYARILSEVQPRVFVAENVSGLVKGRAKGYFLLILKALKEAGYQVEARLLDAQWLGVPQMRQRVIFVGVRNDLGLLPAFPEPLPYNYSVREAIPWIQAVSNLAHGKVKTMQTADKPCPTVTAKDTGGNGIHSVEAETDISRYAIGEEWERMGAPGTKSERYLQLVRPALDRPCPTITAPPNSSFSPTASSSSAGIVHPTEKRKFSIEELKRVCAFPHDFELTGSYAQQWERLGRAVPPLMMYHIAKAIKEEILDHVRDSGRF